jgi:hypothetical protein
MEHQLLNTLTVDDDTGMMWSFASIMRPSLKESDFEQLSSYFGLNMRQLSLIALPLCLLALLKKEALGNVLMGLTLSENELRETPSERNSSMDFAQTIMCRPLVPVQFEEPSEWYDGSKPHIELYSLADLISESGLHTGNAQNDSDPQQSLPELYWGTDEQTSFLLLKHRKAFILGGSTHPYQLFGIWKSFLDWLNG